MADHGLEIEIEIAQLKESVAQLQEAAKAAQAGAEAQKDLGRSVQQGGEHTKIFNVHGREMHKLIHEMNRVVPGLGLALRSVFHPEAIGIGVAVIGLQQLVGLIETYRKKLEEIAKERAQMDVAIWEGEQEKIFGAADAAKEYHDKLKQIASSTDDLKQVEEEQLAVLNATIEARAKLTGKKDEAQADAQRRQQLQFFLALEKGAKGTAMQTMESAQGALQAGTGMEVQAKVAQAFLASHGGDVEKAQEALNKISGKGPGSFGIEAGGNISLAEKMYADALKKATDELAAAKTAQEAATHTVKAHEQQLATLKKNESDAVAAFEKANNQFNARQAELHKLDAVHSAQVGVELGAMGFKEGSVAGRTVAGVVGSLEARGRGEQLTIGQQQGIAQMRQALHAAGQNWNQIAQIMNDLMDLNKSHTDKFREVFSALKILKAQVKSSNSF